MARAKRRSGAETQAAVADAKRLIEGGMSQADALRRARLSESVYRRNALGYKVPRKRGKRAPIVHGTASVADFPPPPKRGGKRPPKQVNMDDVASVATRISRLDKKLGELNALTDERKELASRLIKLLR